MTTPDPIYEIVDGHAVLVSPEALPVRLCECGQPTVTPTLRQCRACLHAEIAANTARLREKHPELFTRGSRIKGWRDRHWNGS